MENIKNLYDNNKFKISAPIWNYKFELPDWSYSVSGIPDYFEYILEKHNEKIDNPSTRIYVNKTENRVAFKIKTGYYLKLLTPETMKLLGDTLEIIEVVLVHCNMVNICYQQDSRGLYTFVPNKPFGSLS